MSNYDTQSGIPVADSDHMRDVLNRAKATYDTRDIWQAAYLDEEGVQLLGMQFDRFGRTIFIFWNEHDIAWQTGKNFREGVSVDIEAFRQAYKRVVAATKHARRGETINGSSSTR